MEKLEISPDLLQSNNWNEVEQKNVQTLAEFVQLLMNDHNFQEVLNRFDNSEYTQHNRGIPDGLKNLVTYIQNFTQRFPEYTYDVKKIIADGDYVVFHSHVTIKKNHRGNDKKGLNIIDTWKVKDGIIVEHWDSIQPLDFFMRMYVLFNGGKIKNKNGVY